MTQHAMVIDNGTGFAVRTAINGALVAQATQQGGPTAPLTTYAGQEWWDTTNNLIKKRNNINTAWVTIASYDGTTYIPYSRGLPLDELGEWTPILSFSEIPGSHPYSLQVGRYRRSGSVCQIFCNLALVAFDTAASGSARITGLPFQSASIGAPALLSGRYNVININSAGGYYSPSPSIPSGTARIELQVQGDNLLSAQTSAAAYSATTNIIITGQYLIA